MVQRSPTMVVNVEPSAQLYDGLYLDFDNIEDQDLINISIPFDVMIQAHKQLTKQVTEIDRETAEQALSADKWMRTVNTEVSDFLSSRFALEAAREQAP